MDITPSESFTRHELSALLGTPLVDMHMENALAGVRDTMYPLLAPRELSVVTSEYVESAVIRMANYLKKARGLLSTELE
jgi:hypothetical protein